MTAVPTDDVRLALLERDVREHGIALFGLDGESGLSGRMRRQERFQARVGAIAALGAVFGGMAVELFAKLVAT